MSVRTEASRVRTAEPSSPNASPVPPAIRFLHVSKQFARADGTRFDVLRDVSFDLPSGKIVAILGPSGSGKTTLLNMAAGLVLPDRGEIIVMGEELGRDVDWSRVGYMFQDDLLLPWRTAIDNAAARLRSGDPSRVTKVASATWVASTGSIGAPWMPSVKAPGAGAPNATSIDCVRIALVGALTSLKRIYSGCRPWRSRNLPDSRTAPKPTLVGKRSSHEVAPCVAVTS
jgi:hypothetical protein